MIPAHENFFASILQVYKLKRVFFFLRLLSLTLFLPFSLCLLFICCLFYINLAFIRSCLLLLLFFLAKSSGKIVRYYSFKFVLFTRFKLDEMNNQFFLTEYFWPKDYLDEFCVDKKWKKRFVDFIFFVLTFS